MTALIGHRAGLARPWVRLHHPVGRARLDRLHRPGHLRARQRHGGRTADPRPRRQPAEDLRRRQDLHVHAAQGPRLLQRRAGQGQRLHLHDRARDQAQLGRQGRSSRTTSSAPTAFDKGKAKTISGITTDDATGKITIKLVAPYGAFVNVLAFPSGGLVPERHADEEPAATTRRPASGPYMITNVVPNKSFTVVMNPKLRARSIPGIPAGQSNVNVRSCRNTPARGASRCSTTRPTSSTRPTRCPASLLHSHRARPSDRYAKAADDSDVLLLPEHQTEAVQQPAGARGGHLCDRPPRLARLDCGFLTPGVLLPAARACRSPDGTCPYGDSDAAPNLAKAKQLIAAVGHGGHAGDGVGRDA